MTITGGTVSGFDAGIWINSGAANTVTKMTVKDNIGVESSLNPFPDLGDGILIQDSSLNKITSNKVIHNGTYDGISLFGLDTDSNLVQGNTVQGTITNLSGNDGEGIIANNFLITAGPRRGESIYHNDIIGNTVTGNAASGISNNSNDSSLIENNTVTGNGLLAFPNNGIGDQVGGHANPVSQDTISGNTVSGNGGDGIQILQPTSGDTVSGNTVKSNNALNQGFFNLEDTNGNCTTNTWTNNTVTSGGVSPACLLPGPAAGASPAAAAAQGSATPAGPAAHAPDIEAYPQAHRPQLPPPSPGG